MSSKNENTRQIEGQDLCLFLWLLVTGLFVCLPGCNSGGSDANQSVANDSGQNIKQSNSIENSRFIARVENFISLRRYEDADQLLRLADSSGLEDQLLRDLRLRNLLSWAEESLAHSDTTTFIGCASRLIETELPDSTWQTLARLMGLGPPVSQVTNDVVADYAPRFFPTGDRLVYFSRLERERLDYAGMYSVRYQTQLCAIGLSGESPTVISDGAAAEFFPDVSPDGRYVICQRAEGDTLKGEWTAADKSYLYLYDLTTGEGRRPGDSQMYGRCPRFMPLGREVVFNTWFQGEDGRISSLDLETDKLTPRYASESFFVTDRPRPVFCVSFSADESKMVFQAGYAENKAVYTADAQGRGITRLTPLKREWSDRVEEWNPTISPDGENIIFISRDGRSEELYIRNVNHTTRRQLTFDGMNKAFPAYSPDGKFLAYSAKRPDFADADFEIYLLDLSFSADHRQLVKRVGEWARRFGIH